MSLRYGEPAWWQRLADCLQQGRDGVLVTVARAEGSTPRDAGATMLVEWDAVSDTLGGGNLEMEAMAVARRLLAGEDGQSMIPYTLGPGLRQCCGGAVWLLYERIRANPETARRWQRLRHALQQGERVLRSWSAAESRSEWRVLAACEECSTRLDARLALHWQQVVDVAGFPVRLFGAGHVGRALARVIATTEARLQWIDPRREAASAAQGMALPLRCCEEPLDAVHDALPGTWFVIMTHSHALDFELVEAVLRRRDAAFCGLIGSATKAARFRHNLRRQGLDAAMVAGLTCPLGVPGIRDKSPATIAISIAAQLLQSLEMRRAALARPTALAERRLQP
jgi:xanthine dehydrogenase accessory factor